MLPRGLAKLSDFGIAKSLGSERGPHLTPMGRRLGTMACVVLEQ
jgi:hypothetical protein